jgi:hypothetical protein
MSKFQRGQSGNPRGRRPRGESLAEIFRRGTNFDEILEILLGIVRNGSRARDRIEAARLVLDRSWGKAPVTVDLRHGLDDAERQVSRFRQLSDEQLELLATVDALADDADDETSLALDIPDDVIDVGEAAPELPS